MWEGMDSGVRGGVPNIPSHEEKYRVRGALYNEKKYRCYPLLPTPQFLSGLSNSRGPSASTSRCAPGTSTKLNGGEW